MKSPSLIGVGQFSHCASGGVIHLVFADGESLLVGENERHKISRLQAADAASPPKLTSLTPKGLKLWKARVQSVQESTRLQAQDILALYAARNNIFREPCTADGPLFKEFEARFDYEPTQDQITCFSDVETDMVRRCIPMDRLVVGDVGFGKTEIAMRAIYRAVLNNRQVAFLAPTTVLASQHFRSLSKRMPGVRIDYLRGGSSQSQEGKNVREFLRNGTSQVVVGTHALLHKDVAFKKLELLIIDEEQVRLSTQL